MSEESARARPDRQEQKQKFDLYVASAMQVMAQQESHRQQSGQELEQAQNERQARGQRRDR